MTSKYHISQELRVRTDLEIDKVYSGLHFCNGMADLAGQTGIVIYIEDNDKYRFEKGGLGNFIWAEEMLEPYYININYEKT